MEEGQVYCSGHGMWLPKASFYDGSLRAGESRCKLCNGKTRRDRRRRDVLTKLQWKLYQTEYRKGGKYPSAAFVKSIFDRYCGKSALDPTFVGGAGGDDDLCVVRYYADLPLDVCPWNAVLVTCSQARHLPRSPLKRETVFPPDLQQEMQKRQMAV